MAPTAMDFFPLAGGGVNLHGNAVAIAFSKEKTAGLLITGASGSGKTQLCFELLERAESQAGFGLSGWVSDDRTHLRFDGSGCVLASAPANLRGLAEMRYLGPVSVAARGDVAVTHWVQLMPEVDIDRVQDAHRRRELPHLNVMVDFLQAPAGKITMAARLIECWLTQPPDSRVTIAEMDH